MASQEVVEKRREVEEKLKYRNVVVGSEVQSFCSMF